MRRFVLRFAVRCLAVAILTSDTANADVSCTDDPGNSMCQFMSGNKGSIEDRRAYYPQSQQDPVSGETSLDMFSSPAFQSSLGSLYDNSMPLWLFMGLGLDKRPETVALYHGPSGFAVTLAPLQANLNEDGNVGDIASGSNQQVQKASKQLSQIVAAGAQPTSQKKSAWQFQTQQQMAARPKNTNAYNTFQSNALMPQRSSAPAQPIQGVKQPQSLGKAKPPGLGFAHQGNSNTQFSAAAMVPSSAGQQGTSQSTWLSPGNKINQAKPSLPNQAAPNLVTVMKQPTTMQQYQQSFPVGSATNQKFATTPAEQKQYLQQSLYQQGITNGLQNSPPVAPRQPVGPGQYHFQQQQHQAAAVTTQTRPNFSPNNVATAPQGQLPGQQSQTTIPQSLVPDAQRQQNGAPKTTLPQQLSSPQQTLTGASTKASPKSAEALSTQQQQRGDNATLNSTQGPAVPEQAGKAATAAPTNAAKEEGSLTAGTPPNESIATTVAQTPATQKPLTEQQEALRKVGITSR